jgi:hypothetical protein
MEKIRMLMQSNLKKIVILIKFINMEAIIIEVQNEADIKFWLNLAKKTGTRAKSIDTENLEDARLADLIEKGMKTQSVSRESVMEILGQKKQ